MNKLMTLLTTMSVSCAAACNVAPLIPRSAANSYPPPGPNLAHQHEVSLDLAIQRSVEDEENLSNLDFALSLPALSCEDQEVRCGQHCEGEDDHMSACMVYCADKRKWCDLDSIHFH
jgi:hypothetical protein